MNAFMREVTFSFLGPDRLYATWTSWENGKEKGVKPLKWNGGSPGPRSNHSKRIVSVMPSGLVGRAGLEPATYEL